MTLFRTTVLTFATIFYLVLIILSPIHNLPSIKCARIRVNMNCYCRIPKVVRYRKPRKTRILNDSITTNHRIHSNNRRKPNGCHINKPRNFSCDLLIVPILLMDNFLINSSDNAAMQTLFDLFLYQIPPRTSNDKLVGVNGSNNLENIACR